jgi:hypothetical protein
MKGRKKEGKEMEGRKKEGKEMEGRKKEEKEMEGRKNEGEGREGKKDGRKSHFELFAQHLHELILYGGHDVNY